MVTLVLIVYVVLKAATVTNEDGIHHNAVVELLGYSPTDNLIGLPIITTPSPSGSCPVPYNDDLQVDAPEKASVVNHA